MSRPGHGHGHAQWRVTLEPSGGGGGGGGGRGGRGGEVGVGFFRLFCPKFKTQILPKTYYFNLYWFSFLGHRHGLGISLAWMLVRSCQMMWKMDFYL